MSLGPTKKAPRLAFTLVELLVVIAIVGVLVALLLPAIQKVRTAALKLKCQNNLRQIGIALHTYHDSNGCFPLGLDHQITADAFAARDVHTWWPYLLPYVEQPALYNQWVTWKKNSTDQLWNTPSIKRKTVVPLYMCPSDPINPKTETFVTDSGQGFHGNYVLCAGSTAFNSSSSNGQDLNGLFYSFSTTRLTDILDGSSNTVMGSELKLAPELSSAADPAIAVETANGGGIGVGHDLRGRYWHDGLEGGVLFSTLYPPNTAIPDRLQNCNSTPEAPCQNTVSDMELAARSYHPGGVNAVFADGSVHFLENDIDPSVYQALGTRAGGEPAGVY